MLSNLESESLSEALILALLTMPEDGKPDNYICEPTGNGQYRLIGIDNDHAFAPPVAMEKGQKELKVKCCLFCLDQMKDPVHPRTRETLLYKDAVSLIRDWILVLKKRHAAHARLFCNEEEVIRLLRDKKEPCALGVPFRTGAVKRLCDKMVRIQNMLQAHPTCTHLELMTEVEPMLAVRYSIVLAKQGLSVGERFRDVDGEFFSKVMAGQYESMFNSRQMLSMNLLGVKMDGTTLMRMLKGEEHGPTQALEELNTFASKWKAAAMQEFMELRGADTADISNLPASRIEEILSTTNFQDVPVTTQQILLDELKQKDLRRLELSNCVVLQDRMLEGLFAFQSLVSLKLFGCLQLQLSFAILQLMATKCKALQDLVLSDLPLPRRIAKAGVASLKHLALPNLVTVYIFRCPALTEIKLFAPNLQRLSVEDCPRLAVLDVVAPSLDRVDVRECGTLQERELSAFTQGCRSPGLAFLNVELFGLEAEVARTLYGGELIRSLLEPGGEQFWSVAKRVASIADDGPPLKQSVMVECLDRHVGWRAAENVFVLSRSDSVLARQVLGGEPGTRHLWDLALNAARVSISQCNDKLAQTILAVGAKVNLDVASAIAVVAVTDGPLGVAIMKVGERVNWQVAQSVANIAVDDPSLAEPLVSIGNKQGWEMAANLIAVAERDREMVKSILALGAEDKWDAVACVGQVAVRDLELGRCILHMGENTSWQMALSLARFATNDRTTSHLNLFNCGLTAAAAHSIAVVLKSNSNLRSLCIFGNNLGDAGGKVLLSTLREGANGALGELWLWDCGLGPESAAEFGAALRSNHVLGSASFRGTWFGDVGGCAIAAGLAVNTGLTELRLRGCKFGAATAAALGKALTANKTLAVLELFDEDLGDAGGCAVAAGVAASDSLLELYVYNCNLGPATAAALATALAANPALEILDLYDAALTDAGATQIVQALKHNSTLTELRLWKCQAGPATVAALDTVLGEANGSLEVLSLSTECLTPESMQLLAQRLRACSLQEVRLLAKGLGKDAPDLFTGATCAVRLL
jgi:Ran GTPase-activating protein (RanGAP) involved in mRNA processing and transport